MNIPTVNINFNPMFHVKHNAKNVVFHVEHLKHII